MIAYVTVGADDLAAARRFYDAFLPALGYETALSSSDPAEPGRDD